MQKNQKSWKFFLLKKLPLYLFLLLAGFLGGMFVIFNTGKQEAIPAIPALVPANVQSIQLVREGNFELISPLLLTDGSDESDKFNPLKEDITRFIEKKKMEGVITSASVIVRRLKDDSWMAINKNEMFSPGSIMKVPTLITILKEAERNPGLLNKKILFRKHFSQIPQQTITSKGLTEGTYYTVKDLLYFMIVSSDNDATALLNNTLNYDIMKKLFSDLGLAEPGNKQADYLIDVSDCSKFLTVLYNATYLNKEMSQYALHLLTQSAYKEGITKDLDPSVKVAHKFGERNVNGEQQLHEFGIVYVDDSPYLLGVMTKGNDNLILPQILSGVSGLIYQGMKP